MQVSDPNNVKIYNLSAGKSLPEWLSERKRRALLKKNVDIRRRIELIQILICQVLAQRLKCLEMGSMFLHGDIMFKLCALHGSHCEADHDHRHDVSIFHTRDVGQYV
ncbi:hypothetical protein NQ317_012714 [Molorchus minor]|uniref:Nucleolar protein 10-like N-terminal domain-containing protein n=1 Tax=Molorchus minor TaxID=1323400 RepID=A0ABQ9J3D9_9CUCU|nr:hypothetical protein NQ317_012714 [Molorchus minor]